MEAADAPYLPASRLAAPTPADLGQKHSAPPSCLCCPLLWGQWGAGQVPHPRTLTCSSGPSRPGPDSSRGREPSPCGPELTLARAGGSDLLPGPADGVALGHHLFRQARLWPPVPTPRNSLEFASPRKPEALLSAQGTRRATLAARPWQSLGVTLTPGGLLSGRAGCQAPLVQPAAPPRNPLSTRSIFYVKELNEKQLGTASPRLSRKEASLLARSQALCSSHGEKPSSGQRFSRGSDAAGGGRMPP